MAAVGRDEVATSRFFRLWPEIGAEVRRRAVTLVCRMSLITRVLFGTSRRRACSRTATLLSASFVRAISRPARVRRLRAATTALPCGKLTPSPASPATASSPMYYLAHLTSLFESIGLIIDQHQPVVEKYYGIGRMRSVVARLQVEADRVVESLVSGWEEERRARRVLNSLRVSAAKQSTEKPPAGGLSSTHLSSLPNAATSLLQTYSRTRIVSSSTPTPTPPTGLHAEEEGGPDAREVDKLLGELTAMAGRWGLYRRFLWSRLRVGLPMIRPPRVSY